MFYATLRTPGFKAFRLTSTVIFAILLLALLQGCVTNNTISDGADANLMLKGHDPVSYFTMGKHVLGKPDIKADHAGVIYRFASADHHQMFLKSPDKFVPQYGGFCANGMVYGIPWGGDPDTWKIIDGRLFIFGGEASKKYFLMDEKRNLALADSYWNSEVKGTQPRLQTWKRLVIRVPHYKSGNALEAEWQARQSEKAVAPKPRCERA